MNKKQMAQRLWTSIRKRLPSEDKIYPVYVAIPMLDDDGNVKWSYNVWPSCYAHSVGKRILEDCPMEWHNNFTHWSMCVPPEMPNEQDRNDETNMGKRAKEIAPF
jgi:hypothetical protein